MEQQAPSGESPQTVLPLLAPQVPSLVTAPVGGASDGARITGSDCKDEAGGGASVGAASTGSESKSEAGSGVVPVPLVVQPLWHPCAFWQLTDSAQYQSYDSPNLLYSQLSTPSVVVHKLGSFSIYFEPSTCNLPGARTTATKISLWITRSTAKF